ncbi:hypothetical protein FRB90_000570 [Tulasnella sp. 427]|nr:hypothetical protein FRB90_000570 [Tulasnella sp. 427]
MTTSTSSSSAEVKPQAPASSSPRADAVKNREDDSDDDDKWHDACSGSRSGSPLPPPTAANDPEEEEPAGFTDEEIRDLLKRGDELKSRGNELFRKSDWEGAIGLYTQALKTVPLRPKAPQKRAGRPPGLTEDEENDDGADHQDDADNRPAKGKEKADIEEPEQPQKELTPLEKEAATARSVLNANLAACYVKMGKHEEAVRLCTEALVDDPNYIKALHRRATSNELVGSWTSLSDAQKDYQRLLELLPPSDPLRPPCARAVRNLPARIEVQKKKETDEMLGKLKDLGNSVLGKFGLSTNNFQFTPNGQGGYSMNFVR